MDITSLSSDILRELAKLADQKASLTKQIEAIDSKINAVAKGLSAPKPKAASSAKAVSKTPSSKVVPPVKAKRGRRGHLKQQIIALLSQAGVDGLGVKEISKTLGVKNQNVHVWFSTTGRKIEGITKLAGARYSLLPAGSLAPAAVTPEATAEVHHAETPSFN